MFFVTGTASSVLLWVCLAHICFSIEREIDTVRGARWARSAQKNTDERQVILVTSGGACRGKTTVAETLRQRIGPTSAVIHLDEIHYDRERGPWVRRSPSEWTEYAQQLEYENRHAKILIVEGVPRERPGKYARVSAAQTAWLRHLQSGLHLHL